MKKLVFLSAFSVLWFAFAVNAQEKSQNQYADIQAIDYCEIIKNAGIYKDKIVKIFAEWSVAFEFSGLGSPKCAEDYRRIWGEFENYQSCGDERTAKILVNRNKGIEYNWLEGNFVGKFFVKEEGKSGFGHMNGKPYKLVVSCIENAVLLPKENAGCSRVDETSPFHYLEYVKIEENFPPSYEKRSKKKEKIVWFRLVNNSSCQIIVPTVGNHSELQDKAKVLVNYKLDATIRTWNSSLIPINGKDRIVGTFTSTRSILSAGNSILFAVPLRYFTESYKVRGKTRGFWNISVQFEYADRQAETNYDPFYFSWNDLPKEIFKK